MGYKNLVSPWTFWVTFAVGTILVFTYEIPRNGGPIHLWLVANLIAQAALGFVMWSLIHLVKPLYVNVNATAALNLTIMVLAALARALTFGLVTTGWGLGLTTTLSYRISGSISMGIAYTIGCGMALTARSQHAKAVAEYASKRERLNELYELTEGDKKSTEAELKGKALDVLLPQFERLQKALEGLTQKGGSKQSLIQEFQEVLVGKVQPLTLELDSHEESLEQLKQRNVQQKVPFWLKTIYLRESVSDVFVFAVTSPNMVSAYQTTLGGAWGLIALIPWVLSWMLLRFLKKLFPVQRKVKSLFALVSIAILATLSMAPYLVFTQVFLPREAHLQSFGLAAAGTIPLVAVLLAGASGLNQNRGWLENELSEFNDEFARQLGIYRQKAWLARKYWVYLVHGTVQASLTSAIIELTRANEVNAQSLKRVNQLLVSVFDEIQTPRSNSVKLDEALNAISATWMVCQINFDVNVGVFELAKENQVLAASLNEVCKELVSNAVRHGSAENISIAIEAGSGFVSIVSTNDGSVGHGEDSRGLGSTLFDNMCIDWSFEQHAETGLATFRARVAV